jgi:hypothetical protein
MCNDFLECSCFVVFSDIIYLRESAENLLGKCVSLFLDYRQLMNLEG